MQAPLRPSPDQARRWLSEQLDYSDRFNSWLLDVLQRIMARLFRRGGPSAGVTSTADLIVIAIVVALLAVVAWWLWRSRPDYRRTSPGVHEGSALIEATMTADEYRALALQHESRGDFDEALIAQFRAIVADMVRRTVLGRRLGDTAQEVAATVSQVFPSHSVDVSASAQLFDRAAYSHRRGQGVLTTAGDVEFVRTLDSRLVAARPDHQPVTATPSKESR